LGKNGVLLARRLAERNYVLERSARKSSGKKNSKRTPPNVKKGGGRKGKDWEKLPSDGSLSYLWGEKGIDK